MRTSLGCTFCHSVWDPTAEQFGALTSFYGQSSQLRFRWQLRCHWLERRSLAELAPGRLSDASSFFIDFWQQSRGLSTDCSAFSSVVVDQTMHPRWKNYPGIFAAVFAANVWIGF